MFHLVGEVTWRAKTTISHQAPKLQLCLCAGRQLIDRARAALRSTSPRGQPCCAIIPSSDSRDTTGVYSRICDRLHHSSRSREPTEVLIIRTPGIERAQGDSKRVKS